MAENEINIDGRFNTGDVESGIDRLESMFSNFSQGIDLPDEKMRLLEHSLTSIAQSGVLGAINAAIALGASLWQEQADAVKSATQEAKYYNSEIELAIKRHEDMKKAKGFQGGERDQAAIMELGSQEMGFAAKGTWTRWFEEIGVRVRDTVAGGDTDENRMAHGQKALRRGEEIRKNNEEHDIRLRKIKEDIDGMERAEAEFEEALAKKRLDETRERMRKEEEHRRAEDRMLEQEFEAGRRFGQNRIAGHRGFSFEKDPNIEFASSAEDVFSRISAGAGSSNDEQQARERAEQLQREVVAQQQETNKIMADSNVIQGRILNATEHAGGLA